MGHPISGRSKPDNSFSNLTFFKFYLKILIVLETKQSLKVPDKILIAEDEPATRLIFATILQDKGYDVTTCENGRECIELIKNEKFDTIILDIRMPDMDGFEVLKVLKSNPETNNIPVIIISGNTEPQTIKRAFDEGATEFIAKPVNLEELLVRVSNVLKIKKTNDELKKLRSEFTYLLIQDLKNTISVIKGSFELALKNKFNELSNDQKLILEMTEAAINKHIKLLNEYLELSRLEFNIDKISKEQTELDKIITDVLKKFKPNLNLSFQSYADGSSFQIYADKKKITRVIELILEAISNAGGKDVEISLMEDNSNCLIKIVDKTQTIDIEETSYLFDKYKQAVLQKLPRYNDLGLTISRIIVEAHGGKIWAEPGEGTVFFIQIPKI